MLLQLGNLEQVKPEGGGVGGGGAFNRSALLLRQYIGVRTAII